ncbi:P-loop containing nucleoside triphosphate hydrolase protein, partial [Mycena olivaceomarginata]
IRLNTVTTALAATANSLKILADAFDTPFLGAIVNTTQVVLKNIQTVKQNKDDCVELLEQTHKLLTVIIIFYVKSETGAELPPSVLDHIGKFTQILHKIYTFIEAHQKGSKIRAFFHQSESSALLKECKVGLQQGLEFFQIESAMISPRLADMEKDAQKQHQEVLDMIETLSENTVSERGSMISRPYSQSYSSSISISMLPSEPKIFHGRESEVSDILDLFKAKTPRIAILGAGGMGKSSLARMLLHNPAITATYQQNRFFVGCSSATTKLELVSLIGTHMGLKLGKGPIQAVLKHLSNNPPSLLILDELETLWESTESRGDIEELLSLLTDINHLALMITMRGTERPAKVQWTRPFLLPLKPLDQKAARLTFIDIADDKYDLEEVDKILSLTDNMPLAIDLLAHLVDSEGCSNILLRWDEEKTSMISEGFDKRSNLDLSISLSLSSPRMKSLPQSQRLLSLLGMLPDGLSDVDLIQSKLPLEHPLKCKAVLKSTALAYSDEQSQLKVLMPIREYIQQHQHPEDQLVHTLLKHFQDLLHFFAEYRGTQSSASTVNHIASNIANIQNLLQWGLQQNNSHRLNSIRGVCHFSRFHRATGQGGSLSHWRDTASTSTS